MMKTTRHSLMAKGILVLLSLLILIFVFTYSWFIPPDYPATATGLTLTTSADMDFEYAIGFANSQTGNSYYVSEFKDGTIDLSAVKAVQDPTSGTISYVQVGGQDFAFDVLHDYNPIDITGDGYTLIRPAMTYGNWNINTATDNYSLASEGEQYIYFDLIFRSQDQCAIALDEDSYAKGACESRPGSGALVGQSSVAGSSTTDTTSGHVFAMRSEYNSEDVLTPLTMKQVYNQSTYGDFSKDAVVGSLRVAFLEYEKKGDDPDLSYSDLLTSKLDNNLKTTPSLLWIPRPDILMNDNNETSGWTLSTGVASGSTYSHQYYDVFNKVYDSVEDATVAHREVITDNRSCVAASEITSSGVIFNDTERIVSVNVPGADNNNDNEPDYYYGKVRVRIWIEGTDSEARRAITGGNFRLAFNLTAVSES
jgi:hypothetical protein